MKRAATSFALIVCGFSTPACGLFASAQTSAPLASNTTNARPPASKPLEARSADTRRVGDFLVHRFSGSYQKSPLTLTEEVIANEGGLWVIDYTFEEQSGTTKLRVRLDPRTDSVRRVSKLDGSQEHSVSIASYENLIERTSFAADENEGMLSSSHGTCLVGPSELDCETKSYKVVVGDQAATLNVSRSNSVLSGDVAGDIIGSDGAVIYRSELVEMGNASSPKPGVATR